MINQVPMTSKQALGETLHKRMLRRVTICEEESLYKPDIVKGRILSVNFVLPAIFARFYLPLLVLIKCLNLKVWAQFNR